VSADLGISRNFDATVNFSPSPSPSPWSAFSLTLSAGRWMRADSYRRPANPLACPDRPPLVVRPLSS